MQSRYRLWQFGYWAKILRFRFAKHVRQLIAPIVLLRLKLGKKPENLLIAPQDIRTSDPTILNDLNSGYYSFGGRVIHSPSQAPIATELPSPTFAREFYGFSWLRHVRGAEQDTSLARKIVEQLINTKAKLPEFSSESTVAARRLIAFLSHSPVILADADPKFYYDFLDFIFRLRNQLAFQFTVDLEGGDRLIVAIALMLFELCTSSSPKQQAKITRLFVNEIKVQILIDGCPANRNPHLLIETLLDFLPLRQAFIARNIQVPSQLINAIDRMMPMLRLLRHGDGTLALFNGMNATKPESLAIGLAYDDARAQPLLNARYGGYQRLEAQQVAVIIDVGKPPALNFSDKAHASCLAFEFSDADRKIVVNCGRPGFDREDMIVAARRTPAHSSLTIHETSSCIFDQSNHNSLRLIIEGPNTVSVARKSEAGAETINAKHDGYLSRFHCLHSRRLSLAKNGDWLDGEDTIEIEGELMAGLTYQLRFHLHPSISPVQDGPFAVILPLALESYWRFEANSAVQIVPSIAFAEPLGPQTTKQLLLEGVIPLQQSVRWQFVRH